MGDKKPDAGARKSDRTGGISRRNFLTVAGIGAIGATASGVQAKTATEGGKPGVNREEAGLVRTTLKVNGRTHRLLVEPRWSLLYVLRDRLGLTGAKPGCERGECGCCTVLIDGLPRYACMTLALEAEGAGIETVEGLLQGEEPGAVQQAFMEHDAFQCGYCTPGQVMAVEGLLRAEPNPSVETIRIGVSGNLCRCGAYPNIVRATHAAAERKRDREGRS